ncbi:MAG: hypothetical protein HYZ28_26020 [Myxococcales bacterium]|nr:hypothetical protein [Myxococcales bacterium]
MLAGALAALSGCPPAGTADLGNVCTKNSDCKSNMCFAGRCTRSCNSGSECPSPPEYSCAQQQGLGKICVCTLTSVRELCDGRDNDCDGFIDRDALCGAGMTCQSSQCLCLPENLCSGSCVDKKSDRSNCGGCGISCGSGGACDGGSCDCPVQNRCGSTCADLRSDPTNCGACGRSCGGPCDAGSCVPVPLAQGLNNPRKLAVDQDSIYWLNQGFTSDAGEVMRIPKTGGTPVSIAGGENQPQDIAIDGTHVYFTSRLPFSTNGYVKRVSKGGGGVEIWATNQLSPLDVAVNADHLYWSGGPSVWRLSLDGGCGGGGCTPQLAATASSTVVDFAIDPTDIYWLSSFQAYRAPIDGGTPAQSLSSLSSTPRALALESQNLVWTNSSTFGSVYRLPKSGGFPSIVGSSRSAFDIAADDTGVYWTNSGNGALSALYADGGTRTLATGQFNAYGIALDSTHVYWVVSGSSGRLMKVPK